MVLVYILLVKKTRRISRKSEDLGARIAIERRDCILLCDTHESDHPGKFTIQMANFNTRNTRTYQVQSG